MSLELKQIYNLTFLSDFFLHYLYIMHGQKYFNDKEQCEWIDTSLNIAPFNIKRLRAFLFKFPVHLPYTIVQSNSDLGEPRLTFYWKRF